jgi:hypothetical protein
MYPKMGLSRSVRAVSLVRQAACRIRWRRRSHVAPRPRRRGPAPGAARPWASARGVGARVVALQARRGDPPARAPGRGRGGMGGARAHRVARAHRGALAPQHGTGHRRWPHGCTPHTGASAGLGAMPSRRSTRATHGCLRTNAAGEPVFGGHYSESSRADLADPCNAASSRERHPANCHECFFNRGPQYPCGTISVFCLESSGHGVLSCITERMESARNSGHSYPLSRCQYLERPRPMQAASPRGCGSPYSFYSGG